jgi:hypothetical protein
VVGEKARYRSIEAFDVDDLNVWRRGGDTVLSFMVDVEVVQVVRIFQREVELCRANNVFHVVFVPKLEMRLLKKGDRKLEIVYSGIWRNGSGMVHVYR